MQIPTFGSDFIGAAVAFQQSVQTQNLNVEVTRKALDMQKAQGADLLQLLNPEHLGQKLDIRA